jgi:AcrR family transcriptional regulator
MKPARNRFARARRPGEKEARRTAILEAAARLLEAKPLHDIGLNAIAQEAGLSKPNLYRYFESREEILLELFLQDLGGFADEVQAGMAEIAPVGDGAAPAVATVLARAYARRPRLCLFLGAISSVLEYNVSTDVVVAVKRTSLALAERVAGAVARALPFLSLEQCLWLNNAVALFVAGLWPPANPAPVVREVLERPDFEGLRPDFRRDLERLIVTLVAGMRASAAHPR